MENVITTGGGGTVEDEANEWEINKYTFPKESRIIQSLPPKGTEAWKYDIVLNEPEKNQAVKINECVGLKIDIAPKVKSILINDCKEVLVSSGGFFTSLSVFQCDRVFLLCYGSVPSITLEQVGEIRIYMTEEARDNMTIFATKWNNVVIKHLPSDGSEVVDTFLPDQFKYTMQKGKLKFEPVMVE